MQSADKPTRSEIDLALPGEKTQDEIKIEKSGDINALQRYRWNMVRKAPSYVGRAIELLRIEQDLRNTVQEEQCLAKKPEATGSWLLYRNDVQAVLQALKKRYWLLELQWWKVRNSFVEGPLIRAFDLWRSHPLWYMHRVLFEDCVRKGDAVAVTVDVALIARLIKHDSLELDIVWWNVDVVTRLGGYESDVSKEQTRRGKADQFDEPFMLIDEEDEEEVVVP
ncbi:hypothetical protein N7457_009533 [Penicillium paradoxum]|uniref:uncharacterized protein n=1 Tax=Penicillium paradoxum TaxID=176176 RepID=UPI002549B3C1|nr:uncharacterized protein N7457_009533 [Penicillium paradoxum]KAJ5774637.1 hypothetical protein N7457_009533 [Penicillium paradoxum]